MYSFYTVTSNELSLERSDFKGLSIVLLESVRIARGAHQRTYWDVRHLLLACLRGIVPNLSVRGNTCGAGWLRMQSVYPHVGLLTGGLGKSKSIA